MRSMFWSAGQFNQNIKGWDVSNIDVSIAGFGSIFGGPSAFLNYFGISETPDPAYFSITSVTGAVALSG
jgi:hypothetical protein